MAINNFFSRYLFSFFRPRENDLIDREQIESQISPQPISDKFGWSLSLGQYSHRDLHARTGLGQLIYRMKYRSDRVAADFMAEIIIHNLKKYPPPEKPDIITIVPDTIVNRRFSPTSYLADRLAEYFDAEAVYDYFAPTKLHLPQKKRTPEERRSDTEPRYFMRHKFGLNGRRVLLFDDIYGTGQSINEIVRHLETAEPAMIMVLTIVRISDF